MRSSTPARSNLRLTDLKRRVRTSSKMMNVKVPAPLADAISRLARNLGASKTDVVVALLNEGLEMAPKKQK